MWRLIYNINMIITFQGEQFDPASGRYHTTQLRRRNRDLEEGVAGENED